MPLITYDGHRADCPSRPKELRDEWLPRPFALSPASYYSAPYPGTATQS